MTLQKQDWSKELINYVEDLNNKTNVRFFSANMNIYILYLITLFFIGYMARYIEFNLYFYLGIIINITVISLLIIINTVKFLKSSKRKGG